MKTAAIICEYNPFHSGHAYHIRKTKEETGADFIVALMSGNYVQRGTPAIMEKHLRAHMALESGADLVIELPLWFSCSSAPYFAEGAVALLDSLGIIHTLSFGSECGDSRQLTDIASFLLKNHKKREDLAAYYASAGHSYPKAQELALLDLRPPKEWLNILRCPNNLLGLEYIKALLKRNSPIRPFTISRKGNGYHDISTGNSFSSATALRHILEQENSPERLQSYVPAQCFSFMKEHFSKDFPVTCDDFSVLLKSKLLTTDDLTNYLDVSPDLQDLIRKHYRASASFCDLIASCKSKNLTWSRISRGLLHIMLDMTKERQQLAADHDFQLYYQILGFRKNSSSLIRELKKNSRIPMIRHLRQYQDELLPYQKELLHTEYTANRLYRMILCDKFHLDLPERQIIL